MSVNPRPLVATLYNPHTQSKEALIAAFIVRKRLFERLFRDISTAPMTKPEQHYLIQGIRGMGKTTLLLRLAYEVENTPELHRHLIPIVFNEEEYGISSLADVWERTARYLEEADPAFNGIYQTLIKLYGQRGYERLAFNILTQQLRKHGKKLLLLIDNISDIVRKLDKQEEQRLREVLLTSSDLRLIGATSVLIEQFHEYTRPFYEFFKVIHLDGLNREEARELFLKLGETYHTETIQQIVEKQPGRIEAIRRLTGGVIRTMVLLYEILVENGNGSVFHDLQTLLDRVTPLYKHRMDDLPAQQQKIVAALAQAWDAASTKELAQTVRLESKVISAQLTQLIHSGIVEKVETKTKNHLYRLEERFFNIWFLMRFGRTTDQRVLWLIRFFEEMFGEDPEWMQQRINQHLAAIEKGGFDKYPEEALFLTIALLRASKNKQLEDVLNRATKIRLTKIGRSDLANRINPSEFEIITNLINQNNYKGSINILKNIQNKTKENFIDLAYCYWMLNKKNKAMEALNDMLKDSEKIEGTIQLVNLYNGSTIEHEAIFYLGSNIILPVYEKAKLPPLLTDEEIVKELIASYYSLKIHTRKEVCLKILDRYKSLSDQEDEELWFINNLKTISLLWNNKYNDIFINEFNWVITEEDPLPLTLKPTRVDERNINQIYLKLLLAKKQYHTAYQYFQQEEWQLKDRFKPLYYATLHYLREEYPTDYLRMGPELKETVEDVIKEVEQMAIDYA